MVETGSIADHDTLVEALAAYDDARPGSIRTLKALIQASIRCGYDYDQPVDRWARTRVQTYTDHKDTVDHAVSRLNEVVKELEEEQ